MPIRLLLCLLLAVAVDGSLRRHHALKKLHKNSVGSIRPWSPFHAWHQHRIEPWFLRWPAFWRLGSAAKDINVASVKQRRRWSTFRARRSKWSQLFSKLNKHDFHKVPKQNPFLSWPNSIDKLASTYDLSKTLESASHYAKPPWLQRLRNNRDGNTVDSLPIQTLYAGDRLAKVSNLKWDERRGESKSGFLKTIHPIKGDFPKSSLFSEPLPRLTDHKHHPEQERVDEDLTSGEEWSGLPVETTQSHSQSPDWRTNLEKAVKFEIAKEFDPYKSTDDHVLYQSGETSAKEPANGEKERKMSENFFSLPIQQTEGKEPVGPISDRNSGIFDGQGFPASGETFEEHFSSGVKTSPGFSYGIVGQNDDSFKPTFEETLQPMERSTGDTFGHDFGSFEPLVPGGDDYYSTYMDFDESGFGSFGSFGPFDEGSFVNEGDCDGIETRACKDDSQCKCLGMYFCVSGTCSTVSTSSDDQELPPEMSGIWHETPMTE
ncbi:uncharacterized protein LOC135471642 [Liolophura sinensis]|uniref:uncharacterized protein LOC135471642 n=1 Tax=Liolophura sinensis TaxID=3198878 RepID=UPI003159421D